jgi:hypothetical protein
VRRMPSIFRGRRIESGAPPPLSLAATCRPTAL